jgi:hypothetical protein
VRHAAGAAFACGLLAAQFVQAEPLAVTVHRIENFSFTGAELGAVTFLGGMQLTSKHDGFGGVSGVAIEPDAAGVLLLTDGGRLVRARLVHDGRSPDGHR